MIASEQDNIIAIAENGLAHRQMMFMLRSLCKLHEFPSQEHLQTQAKNRASHQASLTTPDAGPKGQPLLQEQATNDHTELKYCCGTMEA